MSGIVGIVHQDGAPVDRGILSSLTAFMRSHGPDAERIWCAGQVGFGHTLLKTTDESEHETQPFTLDSAVWIVADARIDAQPDLIAELQAYGEDVQIGVPDVELVLRSYRVWGDDCVTHLLGDFVFAVWDARNRRLFCARDQLGVKPLYFVRFGQTLIFSNSLDCLRRHPAASERLNDEAIGDFLLFGLNQNPSTTTFADIQRLPPAHHIVYDDRAFTVRRYWTMPIDEPLFFAREAEYLDRFADLIRTAVNDRLRTRKVSVFMSGGLDSTTLAAFASELLGRGGASSAVHAFVTLFNGLDGDEGYYANLVAAHLNIGITERDLTTRLVDPHWEQAVTRTPEPISNPTRLATSHAEFQNAAAHARVGFYGEGPDNALKFEWKAYLLHLIRTRRAGRLVADVGRHVMLHRRIPLLPTIPRMWRERQRRRDWVERFPDWLDPVFESRMNLRERWDAYRHTPRGSSEHPVRPASYAGFNTPLWDWLFRGFDAETTAAAFEVRHPFVDLRVVRYCLALPAVPWCRRKFIMRRAIRGRLPPLVLERDKTPLSSDPLWEHARRFGLPPLDPVPQLAAYVDLCRVDAPVPSDMIAFRTYFRPRALNYWLNTGAMQP